jgi:integrase
MSSTASPAVGGPCRPIDRRARCSVPPGAWRNLAKAELQQIRFHDLRHTCATLLLVQGIHPKLVQELLGHSNVGITLDTYSHVLPNMGDAAAEAIEKALIAPCNAIEP